MFATARRRAARLAAGVAAAGVVALGPLAGAGLAHADQPGADQNGAATATLGKFLHEADVVIDGHKVPAGTVAMTEGQQTLAVYCIDLHHDTHAGVDYQETGWDRSTLAQNPDRGKIQWILLHSYPFLDVKALATETGLPTLSEDEAAAATQAAIWHFSDGADAHPADATADQLTSWLESHATSAAEPTASLTLSPASVAGRSGLLGPLTVTTSATSADLALTAPAGVTLVDAAGKPVTSAGNGDKFYVKVPKGAAAGSAQITATASGQLKVGRAFAAIDGSSQTMILAGSAPVQVTAQADAQWAPQGPVPSATAMVSCTRGGLEVTLGNGGDQAWTTTVGGTTVTVPAGGHKTVLVSEKQGVKYSVTVTGPGGFSKTFTGALSCHATGGSHLPSSSPTPTGGGLANTGANSATPVIAGAGVALVVVGGAAVFLFRRRAAGRHAA